MLTFVYLDTATGNQFARIDGQLISVNARSTAQSRTIYLDSTDAPRGKMISHCRIVDRRWTVNDSDPALMSDDESRANASF